jgi:Flp pilus assembly protein TadD
MTHPRHALPRALRLLALAAALAGPAAALADEQGDVTQLMRSGQHAQALAKAEQYLAGKPRDPQMRFLKGVVQTEMGRSADAIATFTQLSEDYPELPEPYNNLAVLYAAQSQFDKARAALEAAVRTNPGYATAHENLGDVYARLAMQSYSRARQLDAANTTAASKLALIRQLLPAAAKGAAQPAAKAPGS